MIIDTSAVVAIIAAEPGRDRCIDPLLAADTRRIAAATLLEAYARVDRSGMAGATDLVDQFLTLFAVRVDPVTYVQARIARDALARFGPGSDHPTPLTHGECFALALATLTREPLLCADDRFAGTNATLA